GTAIVRPGFFEKKSIPGPARLGYADYNFFCNPDAASKDHYALSVRGKTEGVDDGFARHDIPTGGDKNASPDPKFRGPIPKRLPFDDDALRARKVTVAQVLAHYRTAYAPAEDSPLIGAGDPSDGAGSYIGAVGTGKDSPSDYFGRSEKIPLDIAK